MRKGGGGPKGAEFERSVCKRLSLWLTAGKRDDLLWRTALSGGRATIQLRKGFTNKAQLGDVCAIDALGEELLLRHVIVEAKFHKKVDLVLGFLRERGKLAKWWRGEVTKAKGTGREPLMIVLENRVPAILVTTEEACRRLSVHGTLKLTVPQWPLSPLVFLFDDIVPRLDKWKSKRIKQDA
jgi:hypothetical protein